MVKLRTLARRLKEWYSTNGRDLPWNHTRDPYVIWVSEVILQQTRVEQGMPYFYRFIEKFPSVQHLANSTEDEVLKAWEGLGYYSRGRNLFRAAQQIQHQYNGQVPTEKSELQKLPGIGEYTASAIAAFAFNQDYLAIDGNLIRVFSRLYGIDTPKDRPEMKKQILDISKDLFNFISGPEANRALMDFGSVQCTARSPNCSNCIFQEECFALKSHLVDQLPVKGKKINRSTRYFYFAYVQNQYEQVYLEKRKEKDIWEGLYQPILIEKAKEIRFPQQELEASFKQRGWKETHYLSGTKLEKHILTHQDILWEIHFFQVNVEQENPRWRSPEEALSLPTPKVLEGIKKVLRSQIAE